MNRNLSSSNIRLVAVIVSLLLSVWHALVNPIPNADAFEYVRTAHVYLDSGLSAAFDYYPSATYSVLMGLAHQLTGMDLFSAGHLINALCYALLVSSFIGVCRELKDTPRIALLAALVILVYPSLNEYRYFLVRDAGFLALSFTAALCLMRFGRTHRVSQAAGFVLLSLAAALFRAEALAYLVLAPLALLAGDREHWGRQVRAVLGVEAALLAGAMLLLILAAVLGLDLPRALQRMMQVYWPFVRDAVLAISAEDAPLSAAIFGEYAANFSDDYLWIFMLAGLSAVLFYSLIEALGLPALVLLLWGLKGRYVRADQKALRVVLAYALIAALILLGFLVLTRFLTTRYTLMFCLMVLTLMPLILERALERARRSRRPGLWLGVLGFLALFSAVDAHVSFGDSKASLQQASDWVRHNTGEDATVMTNSPYVAYFSGRVEDYDRVFRYLPDDAIENASFGTIIVLAPNRAIEEQIQRNLEFQRIEPLAEFPAGEEPDVFVFRRLGN